MKPLVVISEINPASQNIKSALLQMEGLEAGEQGFWECAGFCMAEYPEEIIRIVPKHDAGYYIYASTHRSSSNTPAFTAHTPGNWGGADLGGEPRTLNVALGSKVKAAAQRMKELNNLGWQVAIEADHHGPTIGKPLLFVEIGSTEKEWNDARAGKIAAGGILAAIRSTDAPPCYAGFGGSHYAPKFAPRILDGKEAFGHIISGYALERDGADEGMVRQALEKNEGGIAGVMVDWKGIKQEPKQKLISILDSLGMKWMKA